MKLGVKQMLPFEKNKEIIARLMREHPNSLEEIVVTLRSLRWDDAKRGDLSKLVAFVQEIERSGRETSPLDREIDQVRRQFISQRKKPS